jgi:hypothetical protein
MGDTAFANVGYWWIGNQAETAGGPAGRMHGRSLPVVLPCEDLRGEPETWRKDLDMIIVQVFPRAKGSIRRVRKLYPKATIVARLDRAPEVVSKPEMKQYWRGYLRDLRKADYIADPLPDRRHADYFWQMTGTTPMALPSPILPHPELEVMRKAERDNLIVCLDHRAGPRFPAPSLAAAGYVQRITGCKVIVLKAQDQYVKNLAPTVGLEADWIDKAHHPQLIRVLARAKVVIDLYTMHTPGRINTLAAWMGTPSVASWNSPDIGHPRVDPFSAEGAREALALMTDTVRWEQVRTAGINAVDRIYAPEAIRAAVRSLLEVAVG